MVGHAMTQRQKLHDACTRWLADEMQAAIDAPLPSIPHNEVMARMDDPMTSMLAQGKASRH